MAPGIFVSYRRDDTAHFAGRLVDSIAAGLPDAKVFMDVDSIRLGDDFVEVLHEQLQSCSAALVIIGPRWAQAQARPGQRRLDDPGDFVRLEIEAALARKIPIIPILVDGAEMPGEEELPETLRPVRRRQFVRIDHANYAPVARFVVSQLAGLIDVPRRPQIQPQPIAVKVPPAAQPPAAPPRAPPASVRPAQASPRAPSAVSKDVGVSAPVQSVSAKKHVLPKITGADRFNTAVILLSVPAAAIAIAVAILGSGSASGPLTVAAGCAVATVVAWRFL